MKKSKRKTINKIILAMSAITIILLSVLILEKLRVTDFVQLPRKDQTALEDGPTENQKEQEASTNVERKKEAIEKDGSDTRQAAGSDPKKLIELDARQEDSGGVTVLSKLYGYSTGNCELLVANNNKSHLQSADVIFQREFSQCAGFSVPVSSVGKGTWKITLKVLSDGESNTKSIIFEVK